MADQFLNAALAAERFSAGPQVQSGGSIVADGHKGSLVQSEFQVIGGSEGGRGGVRWRKVHRLLVPSLVERERERERA